MVLDLSLQRIKSVSRHCITVLLFCWFTVACDSDGGARIADSGIDDPGIDNNSVLPVEQGGPPNERDLLDVPDFLDPVALGAALPSSQTVNLARGQTAVQSSTGWGGSAGRAVDGNTSSVYNNGSITSTRSEASPWWQVDLAQSYALSHITLWNRGDCCAERLADFYVFVASTDMRERTLADLQNDPSVWKVHHASAVAAGRSVNFDTSATGRFVRVQKATTGILSLAEVVVGGVNLAEGKSAAQSSTYGSANANLAIDGNIDGNFNSGSVSNTGSELNPWWQLDLGEQTAIGRIKLFNRTDCCRTRLSHFYVFVSETDMRDRSLQSLLDDPDVWQAFEVAGVNASYVVSGRSVGRFVRVQRNTSGYLQLAEVALYGAASAAAFDNAPNPAIYGEWSPAIAWPHIAVHAGLLPSGKILSYDATPDDFESVLDPVASANNTTRASLWDYNTGIHTDVSNNTGDDLFCSGHTTMADGNYFAAGGTTGYNAAIDATNIFQFQSESWRSGPKMAFRRWYPTVTNMSNGELLIAGGGGAQPEIYSPITDSLRTLTGVPANTTRTSWPFIMQAPNGNMLFAGGANQTSLSFLSTEGEGALIPTSSTAVDRNRGSFVVYGAGEMLITGGHPGLRSASKVDMNSAAVTPTNPMQLPRDDHNSIVLPDGSVIVIGGNQLGGFCNDEAGSYAPEIWNPVNESWTLMAAQQYPRQYHSTALLLPDGRVWSGGQGYATIVSTQQALCSYQNNAEIFSPPYLFNADGSAASRPVVVSAPAILEIDSTYELETGQAADIASVSLIRLSTATHATNFSQRFISLDFEHKSNNRLDISLPRNPNISMPGYYMLFVVNNAGTPSIAEMVRIPKTDETIIPSTNDLGPVLIPQPAVPESVADPVTFSAQATGMGVLQYSWNYGDGSPPTVFSSILSTSSHRYSRPGRFNVTVTVRDDTGLENQYTFTQIVHAPLSQTDNKVSSGLLEVPALAQVWSVNPDNDTVAVINSNSLSVMEEIQVGKRPVALGRSADGNVWVVNKAEASITVVNPLTLQVVKTISMPLGSAPHGLVFDNNTAFVALEGLNRIDKRDAITGSVIESLDLSHPPRHLTLDGTHAKLYAVVFITPPLPDEHTATPRFVEANQHRGAEIQVFSTAPLAYLSNITLKYSNRAPTDVQGPGIPNYLGPMVIAPDGRQAWVPSKQDNIANGQLRSSELLRFDQAVRAISSRIDLTTGIEDTASRIDHDNASIASHAVLDSYGTLLFTTLEGNREVVVSDANANTELLRFDVGRAPQGLTISSDNSKLYVHNFMDRTVSVHDVSQLVGGESLVVRQLGVVDTVDRELLSPQVLNGKALFYDARDDRLAAFDYMACASCHNEGGHDGRVWDFSQMGEGLRNTSTLVGRGGPRHGFLHWSANFDEVQDFEAQIREFAGGAGLMTDHEFSSGTRRDPLGDSKAGISTDLDALAAYVNSLTSVPDTPYRLANGFAETSSGAQLFTQFGCNNCHIPPLYTNSGDGSDIEDIGSVSAASGSRLSQALNGIDTPSLLGAWGSAPYLHDGSAATLEEAIARHQGIATTAADRVELARYVRSLSGSTNDVMYMADVDGATVTTSSGAQTLKVTDAGDTLRVQHSPAIAVGPGDFSVSFWMKLHEGPNGRWRSIMQKGDDAYSRNFGMYLAPHDNRIHPAITTTSNPNRYGYATTPLALDKWTSVSYVKQGRKLLLYQDGVLETNVNLGGEVIANTEPLHIGRTLWFTPAIASYSSLQIDHHALTTSEVQAFARNRPVSAEGGNLEKAGTPHGTPQTTVTPFSPDTLVLDSPDDGRTVRYSPEIAVDADEFSVAFWLRLDQSNDNYWRSILHKGRLNTERTFGIWLHRDSQKLHYIVSTSSSWNSHSTTNATLPVGEWTHVVMVLKDNEIKMYLNGNLDTARGLDGTVTINTGDLYIGKSPWYSAPKSAIAGLNLYKRALSDDDVSGLYRLGAMAE